MWKPGTKAPSEVLKLDATAPLKKENAAKGPKPALSHKTLAMKVMPPLMQRKNQAALAKAEIEQEDWADVKEEGELTGYPHRAILLV